MKLKFFDRFLLGILLIATILFSFVLFGIVLMGFGVSQYTTTLGSVSACLISASSEQSEWVTPSSASDVRISSWAVWGMVSCAGHQVWAKPGGGRAPG